MPASGINSNVLILVAIFAVIFAVILYLKRKDAAEEAEQAMLQSKLIMKRETEEILYNKELSMEERVNRIQALADQGNGFAAIFLQELKKELEQQDRGE